MDHPPDGDCRCRPPFVDSNRTGGAVAGRVWGGRAATDAAPAAAEQDGRDGRRVATPVCGPERRILAFGDSLFAGYNVRCRTQAIPPIAGARCGARDQRARGECRCVGRYHRGGTPATGLHARRAGSTARTGDPGTGRQRSAAPIVAGRNAGQSGCDAGRTENARHSGAADGHARTAQSGARIS